MSIPQEIGQNIVFLSCFLAGCTDHFNPLKGDFVIEDNILMRSDKMMIHTGCANAGDEPVYRNNIFVQEEGGQWGRNGANPTTLEMYTAEVVGAEQYAENEFYAIK